MRLLKSFFILILSGLALGQSYPPAAGQEGSTAIPHNSDLFVAWATGAEIERGHVNISDPDFQDQGSNYATYGEVEDALGIADNSVVSLGDAGVATLTFENPIGNGPGYDFAVFENGFSDTFLELAFVEVSSDGTNFFRFPAHSETQTDEQVGGFDLLDPTYLNNFAGKYRAYFGTPFDLDELEDDALLNKNAITHIRLVDVVGSIDPQYATYDSYGNAVNDPFPTPFWSSGFDLDAVGVINESVMSVSDTSLAQMKIYPNPAKNLFYIGINDKVEIKIYDATGRLWVQTISDNNASINISSLEKGIYFVEIKTERKTSLHKLIKN